MTATIASRQSPTAHWRIEQPERGVIPDRSFAHGFGSARRCRTDSRHLQRRVHQSDKLSRGPMSLLATHISTVTVLSIVRRLLVEVQRGNGRGNGTLKQAG